MSLRDQILSDIKEAMKSKDSDKLSVLRFVNAQIKNKEIDMRPKPLGEEEVTQVLKKYLKQRNEAVEQYEKAGRQDLVDKEKYEASVVEAYLPKMLSADELKPLVEQAVKETGASSMKDMGAVMKVVLAQSGGRADGKMVSTMVREALS